MLGRSLLVSVLLSAMLATPSTSSWAAASARPRAVPRSTRTRSARSDATHPGQQATTLPAPTKVDFGHVGADTAPHRTGRRRTRFSCPNRPA